MLESRGLSRGVSGESEACGLVVQREVRKGLSRGVSGERETVWNMCAYLEYLRGRDEMHVTDDGVVRVLLVKANANTKALTVEVSYL